MKDVLPDALAPCAAVRSRCTGVLLITVTCNRVYHLFLSFLPHLFSFFEDVLTRGLPRLYFNVMTSGDCQGKGCAAECDGADCGSTFSLHWRFADHRNV